MQDLNQVTLLVLVLFFVLQLVIYSFCLIKLREVAKQQLSAEMKLKLLENEENLFDFGLYVGLGGTVLSLILVAVGVVEAVGILGILRAEVDGIGHGHNKVLERIHTTYRDHLWSQRLKCRLRFNKLG